MRTPDTTATSTPSRTTTTGRADLHIHTVASDGIADVISIIEHVGARRADVIAITDHERIDACRRGSDRSRAIAASRPRSSSARR